MRFYKVAVFVISTALSFLAFTAIALGIQAIGLLSAPSVPTSAAPLSQIDAAEQAWLALGIDSYRIELRRFRAPMPFEYVTLEVRDGHIITASCSSGWLAGDRVECRINTDDFFDDFTVQDLFATARQVQENVDNPPMNYTYDADILFDRMYHFPTLIVSRVASVYDGGSSLEVLSFEPLP
jgi:hypothetical protein